jgi:hypothetical protein
MRGVGPRMGDPMPLQTVAILGLAIGGIAAALTWTFW